MIRRKAAERSGADARIITDYHDVIEAFENKEEKIYIEGYAYDMLMRRVSKEERLSRWLRALGKYYASPGGLHVFFNSILGIRSAEKGRFARADEEFYRFVREFMEKDYQNYKARNSKSKKRFEFVRIK